MRAKRIFDLDAHLLHPQHSQRDHSHEQWTPPVGAGHKHQRECDQVGQNQLLDQRGVGEREWGLLDLLAAPLAVDQRGDQLLKMPDLLGLEPIDMPAFHNPLAHRGGDRRRGIPKPRRLLHDFCWQVIRRLDQIPFATQ